MVRPPDSRPSLSPRFSLLRRAAATAGALACGAACVAFWGASVAAPAAAGASTAAVPPARQVVRPSQDALRLAEQVRARWMGVDHAGDLWAWEALEGSVRFFSPSAARLLTLMVPLDATAVDGDAAWGAVALVGDGAKLVWVKPGAAPGTHEEIMPATQAGEAGLAGPWGWLCWIDEDTVALAPQRAARRVELWSLRRRKLLKSFGAEREIVLGPGVTRVREVQLRYDRSRRLLFTLDSFGGELAVFSLDGALAWRAKLEDPYQAIEEKTLAELDERAKARSVTIGHALSDLWLAAAVDGTAWVEQQVDIRDGSVVLVKASAAGTRTERIANLRCPSRTFTIWGGQLVFFSDIASPREVCNSITPLP